MLRLFLPLLASFAVPQEEVLTDPAAGVRWTLPDGWSASVKEFPGATYFVELVPSDSAGLVQASLRVLPDSFGNLDAVRSSTVAALAADASYKDHELTDSEFAGRDALRLDVDTTASGRDLHLTQVYFLDGGRMFLLQAFAPVEQFEAHEQAFEALWTGLEVVAVERPEPSHLEQLAERCGSEVDWASDWEDASRRARLEERPILVTVRAYRGFAMSDETLRGTFMDPDIVALVRARFVPWRWSPGMDAPFVDPAVYGLSGTTFGTAALVVSPQGEVLHEDTGVTWEFLVRALSGEGVAVGPGLPDTGTPEERALARLRRGDVPGAMRLLAQRETARAALLRSEVHRLRREPGAGLLELAIARRDLSDAERAGDLPFELDLREAYLLLATGESAEARALLEAALEREPNHALYPEALYVAGVVDLVLDGHVRAEARWAELTEEYPDNRWAWKAAADQTGTVWAMGIRPGLEWPSKEQLAKVRTPALVGGAPAPTPELLHQVERTAVDWLLATQEPDGSWLHPSELDQPPGFPPHDFTVAVTAVAARALLRHDNEVRCVQAVERALAWLPTATAAQRAAVVPTFFMDYAVWSRACSLLFFADAVEAEVASLKELRAEVDALVADLSQREQEGGGFSYYVTGDLAAGSAPSQSISFTTAAVCLGLLRAEGVGFDVDTDLLARALECLVRMRAPNGTFDYMLQHGAGSSVRGEAAGAAGRGPVCTMALLEAGMTDEEDLAAAVALFFEHLGTLVKEAGKALMHTGAAAQGSHYVLFDYGTAAEALALLSGDEREPFREPLLEAILRTRTVDGSFYGSPLVGTAFGTAMTVLALDDLR